MLVVQVISRMGLLISACVLLIVEFLHMGLVVAGYWSVLFTMSSFGSKAIVHINAMLSDEKPWKWAVFCFSSWLIIAAILYGAGYGIGFIRLLF